MSQLKSARVSDGRAGSTFLVQRFKMFPTILVILLGYLCAVSSSHYLGLRVTWDLLPVCFGFIGGIYFINRYSDCREDFINGEDVSRVRLYLFTGGVLLAGTLLYLVFFDKMTMYMGILFLGGVGYSFPIFPFYTGRLCFVRIKDVPLMKNVFTSFLWSFSIFTVPLALAGAGGCALWSSRTVVLMIIIFLSSLINSIFNDLLDVLGDRGSGVRTLATIDTSLALAAIYGCLTGLVFIAYFTGLGAAGIFIVSLLVLLFIILIVLYHYRSCQVSRLALLSEMDLLLIAALLYV